ncbi:hypothetical protein LT85_p042 (plasmid) [Collimonas arenae]|uniref:Uncharacterized protein n=1 Tax=Collimonas arenae TaxID=279058 RepID=A0A0A1FI12_9BURK|nr:hypothetical protein LT85_p042 [Collimonas arenae]
MRRRGWRQVFAMAVAVDLTRARGFLKILGINKKSKKKQ